MTSPLWQLRMLSTSWSKATWRRNEKVQQHLNTIPGSSSFIRYLLTVCLSYVSVRWMMLTAFGQLQETATVIFFIKHGQPQPLRERTRRETLYSFLNEVHEQTFCASSIFTDLSFFFSRSQLLQLRMAKEMVCSEQSDFLLLWNW